MRSSGNGSEKGGKWIILFPAAGIFFYGLYYVNLCLGFHALDGGSYGGAGTDSDRQCLWPYTACFLSFALDTAHISGILRYRGKPVSQLLNECGLRHD